jgi:hypothetical protein
MFALWRMPMKRVVSPLLLVGAWFVFVSLAAFLVIH